MAADLYYLGLHCVVTAVLICRSARQEALN